MREDFQLISVVEMFDIVSLFHITSVRRPQTEIHAWKLPTSNNFSTLRTRNDFPTVWESNSQCVTCCRIENQNKTDICVNCYASFRNLTRSESIELEHRCCWRCGTLEWFGLTDKTSTRANYGTDRVQISIFQYLLVVQKMDCSDCVGSPLASVTMMPLGA